MPSVCFTGRGYNARGSFVERTTWAALADQAGWSVHDSVFYGLTYLVASRGDTSKARAAERVGTSVITYNEFNDLVTRGRPRAVPEYSIGFFRGMFTAMYGETCLQRASVFSDAEATLVEHARRRGLTVAGMGIVYTDEAARQRARFRPNTQAAAGYAPSPVEQVTWRIEGNRLDGYAVISPAGNRIGGFVSRAEAETYRNARMSGATPSEARATAVDPRQRNSLPSATTGRAPSPPPSPQPLPSTFGGSGKRAINWED